jgi:myo-inositol-1(or 4)-monophosphatase
MEHSNFRILAEEETSASKTPPTLTDDPTWIIDPIDGTMNFVNGLSYIAISVSFTIKKELELAILFNPCHDEFYTARRGHGAFLNGQRIYTNNSDSLKDTLMACPAFFHPKLPETMKQYSQKSLGIRQFGSAALNLAYVARGVFGGFVVRSIKPWDVAAGVLLIQEAGGIVTGLDCRPMDLMKPDIICAGNQSLHRQIFEIEEDVERKRREMKLGE